MPVRLNITIDEHLYRRLKRELPAKKVSAFISKAVESHLRPDRATLDAAYKAASRERWRHQEGRAWRAVEVDQWPD